MQFLRSVWQDVKQGENLDLYVTVAVSVALAVLNVLGIAPQSLIAPLNLAVLALLGVAMLGNRHRLEKMPLKTTTGIGEVFYAEFPDEVKREIRTKINRATDLLAIGSNLEYTLHMHRDLFEQNLRRGDTIRVVLVDPNSSACDMTAKRQPYLLDLELQRAKIRSALNALRDLQEQTSGMLEVRLIDYPLSRGGILIDSDTPSGTLYLWNYAFRTNAKNKPKFVLRPADGFWYDYFRDEAKAIWNSATSWQSENTTYT